MRDVKSFAARHKLFFLRGYSFIGNFGIVYLIASKLQEQLIAYYHTSISLVYLVPVAILLTWVIGYVEWRLGLFNAEQNFVYRSMTEKKRVGGKQ